MPALRFDFIAADGRRCRFASDGAADVLAADRLDEVEGVIAQAEAAARAGRYVAGFVSYDAAAAFDPAMVVPSAPPGAARSEIPLAWFAVVDPAGSRPPQRHPAGHGAKVDGCWSLHLEPEQCEVDHAVGVQRVREGIAAGDFYQVNVTQRLRGAAAGDRDCRYEELAASGHGGYTADIHAGSWRLLSLSPELFFHRTGTRIVTRPMKGTAARGLWSEQDDAARQALRECAKDQAENVMIVDLLRNDLGRVAACGSVEVTELFAVEQYPTVHQMTSTVEATLRGGTSLVEIFRALFPCGSVTGAPKIAAMQAIARLEPSARGVYCGAIGLIEPGGDCTFNVAIRTLVLERDAAGEGRVPPGCPAAGAEHPAPRWRAACGVGGGITWDSVPSSEHAEMLLKAKAFLAPPARPVDLLETMRLRDGTVFLLERHLSRMAASARYFGLADPVAPVRAQVASLARRHGTGSWRMRAVARRDGTAVVTVDLLEPTIGVREVMLSARPVCSTDVLLHHKTTQRATYDEQLAAHPGAWDVLMLNERGELTEFTRGNLVLEIEGTHYTPPRSSGLLGGVLRQELLARGELVERVLAPADLEIAGEVYFINALRGRVPVRVAAGAEAAR